MINIIFTISLTEPISDEQLNEFRELGFFWVARIPEMMIVDNIIPVQVLSPDLEKFYAMKSTLDGFDIRGQIEVIGAWDTDCEENVNPNICLITSDYPFNINRYCELLNDIVEYDQDGNITGTRRPTLEEAQNIHVNKFAGISDRQLVQ